MALSIRERYDALVDAIASGNTSVTYSGKSIQYRSLADMIAVAKVLQRMLGMKGALGQRTRMVYRDPNIRGPR